MLYLSSITFYAPRLKAYPINTGFLTKAAVPEVSWLEAPLAAGKRCAFHVSRLCIWLVPFSFLGTEKPLLAHMMSQWKYEIKRRAESSKAKPGQLKSILCGKHQNSEHQLGP